MSIASMATRSPGLATTRSRVNESKSPGSLPLILTSHVPAGAARTYEPFTSVLALATAFPSASRTVTSSAGAAAPSRSALPDTFGTGTRGPRPSFMSGEQPIRTNPATTNPAKTATRVSGLPVPCDTGRDERVADRTFLIKFSCHDGTSRRVAPQVDDAGAPVERGGERVPREPAQLPRDVPTPVVTQVGGIARRVVQPIPVGVRAKAQESTQARRFRRGSHRPFPVGKVAAEVGYISGAQAPVSAGDVERGGAPPRLPHQPGAPSGAPSITLVEDAAEVPDRPLQHRHGRPPRHERPRDLERGVPLVPHLGAKHRVARQRVLVPAMPAIDVRGEFQAQVGLGAWIEAASPEKPIMVLAPDRLAQILKPRVTEPRLGLSTRRGQEPTAIDAHL